MRVQFGQHNPVDRRRWRHEIDFVILSTCVLQVRRISFLDPSSQKMRLRMTTREKMRLRMTTIEINLHTAYMIKTIWWKPPVKYKIILT